MRTASSSAASATMRSLLLLLLLLLLPLLLLLLCVEVEAAPPQWGFGYPRISGRRDTSLVDLGNGTLLLYGGTETTGANKDDVTLFDSATSKYVTVSPRGLSPLGRDSPCVLYHRAQRRLYVFGGTVDLIEYPRDLAYLSLDDWTWRAEPLPGNDTHGIQGVIGPACAALNDTHLVFIDGAPFAGALNWRLTEEDGIGDRTYLVNVSATPFVWSETQFDRTNAPSVNSISEQYAYRAQAFSLRCDSVLLVNRGVSMNTPAGCLFAFNFTSMTLHYFNVTVEGLGPERSLCFGSDQAVELVDDRFLFVFGGAQSTAGFLLGTSPNTTFTYRLDLGEGALGLPFDNARFEYVQLPTPDGTDRALAREGGASVFRTVERELVLHGGWTPTSLPTSSGPVRLSAHVRAQGLSDAYRLRLGATPGALTHAAWEPLEDARLANGPAGLDPRESHAAALWRGRYVVAVGGREASYITLSSHHVQVIDTQTWRVQAHALAGNRTLSTFYPAGNLTIEWKIDPLQCYGHQIAIHNDQLVVVGGRCRRSEAALQDHSIVSVFNMSLDRSEWWAWEPPSTQQPPAVPRHRGVCRVDRARADLWCVGGDLFTRDIPTSAVQVLNLDEWRWRNISTHTASGAPSPVHSSHTGDIFDRRFYVFGGFIRDDRESQLGSNQVWSLDLDTHLWTRYKPSGDAPMLRSAAVGVVSGAHLIVFGGRSERGALLDDVHYLDVESMQWHNPRISAVTSPDDELSGLLYRTATAIGARVLLYGGTWAGQHFNDTFLLHTGTFRVEISGDGAADGGDDTLCLLHPDLYRCQTFDIALRSFAVEMPEAAIQPIAGLRTVFRLDSNSHASTPLEFGPTELRTPLTLESTSANDAVKPVVNCVGPAAERCLSIESDPSSSLRMLVVFRDLEIRSSAGQSAGVHLSGVSLRLHRVVVADHRLEGEGDGGALSAFRSDVELLDTTFKRCSAGRRGGVLYVYLGSVLAERCTFEQNEAVDGAVLHASFADITLMESRFVGNAATGEGGVGVLYFSTSVVSGSMFDGNTAGFAAGAFASEGSTLGVRDSTFVANRVTDDGAQGGVMFATLSTVQVNGSFFSGNEAAGDAGVAYFVKNTDIVLRDSTFVHNVAHTGNGGALFLLETTSLLYACNFTANHAPMGGGGAAHWVASIPKIFAGTIFIDNSAAYGPAFSSPPSFLRVMDGPYAREQTSGSVVSVPYQVAIFDFGGLLVASDNLTFVIASAVNSTKVSILGANVAPVANGIAVFENFGLVADPGSEVQIMFRAIIDGRELLQDSGQVVPRVRMRACLPNEFTDRQVCKVTECNFGQQLVVKDGEPSCLPCPAVGATCTGSEIVEAQKGYWLFRGPSKQTESVACLAERCVAASECPSDVQYAQEQGLGVVSCCADNRVVARDNPLCGRCIDGYEEWGTTCVKCTEPNGGIIFLLLVSSFAYVLIFHKWAQSKTGNGKIGLYFLQMLLIFFGASQTPWLSWINIFAFNVFRAAEGVCVMPISDANRFLTGVYLPLICLGELLVTWAVALIVHWARFDRTLPWRPHAGSKHPRKFHKSSYIRTLIALFIFSFNSVCSTVLSYFRCVDVGERSVMVEYPSITCGGVTYNALAPWMYFLAVFVIVVVPAATLITLRYLWLYSDFFRRKEKRHKMQDRFGILYESYRGRFWYWEGIVWVRRAITIGLAVAFFNDRELMYTVLSMSNVIILVTHQLAQPFRSRWDNLMETVSLTLLTLLTVLLGFATPPFEGGEIAALVLIVYLPILGFTVVFVWTKTRNVNIHDVVDGLVKAWDEHVHKQAAMRRASMEEDSSTDGDDASRSHGDSNGEEEVLRRQREVELERLDMRRGDALFAPTSSQGHFAVPGAEVSVEVLTDEDEAAEASAPQTRGSALSIAAILGNSLHAHPPEESVARGETVMNGSRSHSLEEDTVVEEEEEEDEEDRSSFSVSDFDDDDDDDGKHNEEEEEDEERRETTSAEEKE